jgi:hypothetical protein
MDDGWVLDPYAALHPAVRVARGDRLGSGLDGRVGFARNRAASLKIGHGPGISWLAAGGNRMESAGLSIRPRFRIGHRFGGGQTSFFQAYIPTWRPLRPPQATVAGRRASSVRSRLGLLPCSCTILLYTAIRSSPISRSWPALRRGSRVGGRKRRPGTPRPSPPVHPSIAASDSCHCHPRAACCGRPSQVSVRRGWQRRKPERSLTLTRPVETRLAEVLQLNYLVSSQPRTLALKGANSDARAGGGAVVEG